MIRRLLIVLIGIPATVFLPYMLGKIVCRRIHLPRVVDTVDYWAIGGFSFFLMAGVGLVLFAIITYVKEGY